MPSFLQWLMSDDFLPRGYCVHWESDVLALRIAGDAAIAASYVAIPALLEYVFRLYRHVRDAWLLRWFQLFILGCAATHILDIVLVWHPVYRFDAAVRLGTGVVSLVTAAIIGRRLPGMIAENQFARAERARLEREVLELKASRERLDRLRGGESPDTA